MAYPPAGAMQAGAAPALAPLPLEEPANAPPPVIESAPPGGQSASSQAGLKALLVVISLVSICAIGIAVYMMLAGSPTARLAASLRNAVDSGKFVTLSSDDAYSYYFQLREMDPGNKALTEVAQKALPELRRIGDDVFTRKMSVGAEKLTDQEWAKAYRVYEWACALDGRDKSFEARRRFAEGEIAKSQSRRSDAERSFSAAIQSDQSWSLPQNSMGLLRSESKRYAEAVPYFQRAIDLNPYWEIPYNNMGTAYFFQKDYDAALYWYRRAIEKNPNWARPHSWIGTIYELKRMRVEAISEFQTAINLDPYSTIVDVGDLQRKIDRLQR
jgi:tetratricopeptide (TPR) repeat protein